MGSTNIKPVTEAVVDGKNRIVTRLVHVRCQAHEVFGGIGRRGGGRRSGSAVVRGRCQGVKVSGVEVSRGHQIPLDQGMRHQDAGCRHGLR
jgi:hypothetical protein